MCVAPPPIVQCIGTSKTQRQDCFGMVVDGLKYLFRDFIAV
jgi:hypothetical protein